MTRWMLPVWIALAAAAGCGGPSDEAWDGDAAELLQGRTHEFPSPAQQLVELLFQGMAYEGCDTDTGASSPDPMPGKVRDQETGAAR